MLYLYFGKLFYQVAERLLASRKLQPVFVFVLSLFSSYVVITLAWPIEEPIMFGYVAAAVLFLVEVSVFIVKFVLAMLLYIAKSCRFLAMAYGLRFHAGECAADGKGHRVEMPGARADAEVTLQYFIDKEKDVGVCHAQYAGLL